MGMDGLSMANTGALKESTSADYASRTEQTMQADKTNDPKQIQTMSTNRRIKEKEEEEEAPKRQAEQEAEEEEFDDGLVENPEVLQKVKAFDTSSIVKLFSIEISIRLIPFEQQFRKE